MIKNLKEALCGIGLSLIITAIQLFLFIMTEFLFFGNKLF